MESTQKKLSQDQIADFYREDIDIESKVDNFVTMLDSSVTQPLGKIVDVGGGWGNFAKELSNRNLNIINSP